jgi:hypothetical protein
MYLGSEDLGAVSPKVAPGLFVEAFESPYHEEPSNEELG